MTVKESVQSRRIRLGIVFVFHDFKSLIQIADDVDVAFP